MASRHHNLRPTDVPGLICSNIASSMRVVANATQGWRGRTRHAEGKRPAEMCVLV
jgi:hypothetical protein